MSTENTDLKGNNPKKFDPATDKRIHEILNDEQDTVSEEDIKNIRTDVENAANETDTSVPGIEDIKDDTDPEIDNTSWNVLQGDN